MKRKLIFKIFKRCNFVVALYFFNGLVSFGQSIWTNPITGANPGLTNPYTTGQVVDANITVSGIGHGAGVNGNAGANRYNQNSWNTAGIDLTAYFEFTLTPNATCEIDFVSFVYTGQLSSGTMSFVFRSSVDGFTANIGAPVTAGTTINLSAGAYQNITSAITFRLYGFGAAAGGTTYSINDFTFNGTVTCGCSGPVAQPTAEVTANSASNILCTTAQILWTASVDADNVIVVVSLGAITDDPTDGVNYNANVTFGAGDELVLADGQYVVYNGPGNSITVTGLIEGTNYNYAIFGYDGAITDCEENYLTGGVFGSFTTITGCSSATPQITSVMYNSCNGSSEGTDELVIFQNGSNPINVNDMVIDLPNTTWCNSGCGGNTIGNNATYVSDLNTMAGCALFVYADPIPAGATVIIFTGNPPSAVLDYSTQCGAPGAPFYVLFLNNISITGNFVNTGTTPKTIDITFAPGVSDAVTYVAADGPGNVDGATANFDTPGNATYMTSTGCVYPLSVRLISFYGFFENGINKILWSSGAESHSDHYQIQRSIDGINFETIGTLEAAGQSDSQIDYVFEDKLVQNHPIYYYRLAMVDLDAKISLSETISIINNQCLVTYFDDVLNVRMNNKSTDNYTFNVYSGDGNLILSTQISGDEQIPFSHSGLYIVEIPELRFHQKIVCL